MRDLFITTTKKKKKSMIATWTIQGLLLGAIFVYHSSVVRMFVGAAVIIWYVICQIIWCHMGNN
jgi:uncharacterized membrane protein YdcZ (DUF606 family)